jgi:energy-converting hydrogenase Eha subunit G
VIDRSFDSNELSELVMEFVVVVAHFNIVHTIDLELAEAELQILLDNGV